MQTEKAKTTQNKNFWLWKYKNFHDICKSQVFFIIIKLNNDEIHVSGLCGIQRFQAIKMNVKL